MTRALTYGDFYRTGIQDCGNVLSIDEFDFKAGTPKQIVDKAWAEWEEDGMEEQWLDQQDDLEGLDPHKCYESWRSGWKECAVYTIKEHLERIEEYRLDDEAFERERQNPPAGWWRKRPKKDQPCYATKSAALAKFLDVNYEIVENYGGADYKVGPSEFDAINRKYDLKGKRAARSIAEAVWAAMPVGKPYCLDRIDLDALNDTGPVHESGVPFRLPDVAYESQLAAEEARHYAPEAEAEEPSWVTEHRRFPALPPLPYRLQLEEQEPGVATFSMHTDEEGEPMPEVPPMPPPPRPLTKPSEFRPYRLQLEEREPGVEQYSINPVHPYQRDYGQDIRCLAKSPKLGDKYVLGTYATGSRVQLAEWEFPTYNRAGVLTPGDWVTVVRNGTPGGNVTVKVDRNRATVEKDGLHPLWETDVLQSQLAHPRGRCWGDATRNPPPGEHHRRVAASKGRSVSKDTFYLLDDSEVVVDRFDNLNDALTALAQLSGDGRIALGDDNSRDIIAWSGPPYADSTDGELTIVDARDIRRMFSLAMIRRFNELRSSARQNPPKIQRDRQLHTEVKHPRTGAIVGLTKEGHPYTVGHPSVIYIGSPAAWEYANELGIIKPRRNGEEPKENPAWVTKILSKHFVELEENIPAKWLPKLTKPTVSRGRLTAAMKEYGCGAYGCVLPTLDPAVVLKLTTDDTEAEFAHTLANKLSAPVVVKYHMTRELPDRYKGRPSFLLWRDSADHVGEVEQTIAEEGGTDPTVVDDAINAQHKAAQAAYDALYDGKPAEKLIQKWEDAAREMGLMVPELRELADGMITNLKKNKVFMGDVHSGNIGRVNGHWVVVDPGHIAVLTA